MIKEKLFSENSSEVINYDLCIYGHLSVDRVFNDFIETQSLGCMANVWRAFKRISPDTEIGLVPTSIGEALIYADKDTNQRYSNFVPDVKSQIPEIKDTRISHAMYINKLPDTSWIKNLKGIISADVCAGAAVDTSLLEYLDILFISDEDAFADLKTMSKLTKGIVVLHHSKGSNISDGSKEYEFKINDSMYIPKINVLGAGDIFASSFLHGMLLNKSISECQQYAHYKTSELLKCP